MKLENPRSELIWNSIKRIMKNESKNILFTISDGFYSITPLSIRWKNFFLNNLSWAYSGKEQKMMIRLSDKISKITDMINPAVMDIKEYVNVLSSLNFSIHLTDWDENRKELQRQAKNDDNYAIIMQDNNRVEEFVTTIAVKLFLMNKGYLVGEFEIPFNDYGAGDVIGIKGDFVNKLKSNGIIPFGGDESDFLIWKELISEPNKSNEQTETIVCEIKSSSAWSAAYRQLYERCNDSKKPGYLKSHCFNKGFACFAALTPTEDELKSLSSAGKYEAGSIIFVKNNEPVFNEDTICMNPSGYRKNASLSLRDDSQKQLIETANKKIARLMISNIDVAKVFEGINTMRINDIFREIGNVSVEDVINKMVRH